jgi:glycerol transport system ATP-binding protein
VARIDLQDVGHRYAGTGDVWALRPMTMTWKDGGAYALLGPSGCGKTTLLNIISGLIAPTRGKVLFDGRDVTTLPPEARNIAQVFQFPVVYDTMTVFDNLAFPLRNRGWDTARLRRRVEDVAAILELGADLGRRARALSADQKQKISLGRGLVRPDVAAVLFDEPLTVIDPHLKWLLRRKLKEIHQQLKLSLLYVTHDQTEALTFADQVVVMSQGEIVQVGTPEQLFETPAHRFVGHLLPRLRVGQRCGDDRRSARRDEQHASAAGRRFVVDRSAAGVSGARVDVGAKHCAGARRCDSRPGHPDDGATGNR